MPEAKNTVVSLYINKRVSVLLEHVKKKQASCFFEKLPLIKIDPEKPLRGSFKPSRTPPALGQLRELFRTSAISHYDSDSRLNGIIDRLQL